MRKVLVILNEQHKLMESQKQILDLKFDNWELLSVPNDGWTKLQQEEVCRDIQKHIVVFASPIPYLLGLVVKCGTLTYVLHNDKRDKKELPNGKIISVVATEGWELLEI